MATMIEARRAGRGRRSPGALPCVQPDMMMIPAGRHERGLAPVTLGQREAEHAGVETERAVEIGDLEMDMSDPCSGIDRFGGSIGHRP